MLVPERVLMHREGRSEGFAKKYKCTKLVYYEILPSRDAAYRREKELKGWSRVKKMVLVTTKNISWKDLYDNLVKEAQELMCVKMGERVWGVMTPTIGGVYRMLEKFVHQGCSRCFLSSASFSSSVIFVITLPV